MGSNDQTTYNITSTTKNTKSEIARLSLFPEEKSYPAFAETASLAERGLI